MKLGFMCATTHSTYLSESLEDTREQSMMVVNSLIVLMILVGYIFSLYICS